MTGLEHPGIVAAATPDRLAATFGDTRTTYAELDRQSSDAAARLHAAGLAPGDTVALFAGNSCDFLAAAWAAQCSGLYLLPVPAQATAAELAYLLADSGARALVHGGEQAAVAATATVQRWTLAEALKPCAAPRAPAVEGGDMLYTSGTTGRPKGVKRALACAPLGSETRRTARARLLFGLDGDSVLLSTAPLYHAAPLRFAMNLLRIGGTVVGLPRFDAEAALAAIAAHRVTHSQWVPTMLARLLALPATRRSAHDLSSHRCAIHAGAPCPPHIKRAMIDWWGPILHEYYSGTESLGFTHATSAEWLARPGTVGRAHGCHIHVLDSDGNELEPNATGAIYFSGTSGLAYHNAPEKTAAAYSRQGWATMGDIGHVDADGYLFLTDRAAFTIISGGVNVYPREIENALAALPGVADCAVFGVADADLGEVVMAVVQPAAELPATEASAAALLEALSRALAPAKRPRFIAFETLARSETGKLDKASLRTRWNGDPGPRFAAWELRAA